MKSQRIKYLKDSEKKQLLNTLKDRKSAERDYFLFNLILMTGLRVSEVVALNVDHVKDKDSLEIIGKGNKLREIPLNKIIKKHISTYLKFKKKHKESLDDTTPLFISRNNNRLSIRAVQRSLSKWLGEAKITSNYSPHALRHTFGTELFKRCKNIRLVQDLMGHSDISTTMIYTHVTRDEMEEAVELLSN